MSKKYIFGPATVELTVAEGSFSAELVDPDPFDSNIDLEGAIAQIGTTKFIFSPPFDEYNEEATFTPNGESDPDHGVTFSNVYSGPILIEGASEDITESGPYEISVYVEVDDEPSNGLPDMNITYEFKNTAQNDIEDIIQAIYVSLETSEPQNINGYSPADRLVAAVAALHDVDATTALTTGNYPNQMKRIAAIIRGDFEGIYNTVG